MELGITDLYVTLKSLVVRLSPEDNVPDLILYVIGKPELRCIPVWHALSKDLKVVCVILLHLYFGKIESVVDITLELSHGDSLSEELLTLFVLDGKYHLTYISYTVCKVDLDILDVITAGNESLYKRLGGDYS